MIGMAVAALLLCSESIQAQSRTRTRTRTERRDERRDDRYIPQDDPRRTQRSAVVVTPAPPRPPRIKVVENDVIHAFEHERFDSDRLKMADMVFSTGGHMTSAQIVRVSKSFSFDSDRIKFLKMSYDFCVDAHNFYQVLNTIQFSSSRETIIEFVIKNKEERALEGEPYYKVSSSDMTAILKMLKNETFDSTRSKLARMFVCGNLLTSRQIADMSKTFKFDSSREEFLIYAHRHCSDPQNYIVAVNTLQFSSSRSEVLSRITPRR